MDYNVYKEALSFNLLYGNINGKPKHFVFEWFCGGGLRFRNGDVSIPFSQQDSLYHFHEDTAGNITYESGKYTTFSLCLGIKLGWKFNEKKLPKK